MITYASLAMRARLAPGLFLFLLINSGYIAAFPAASLFYMGNVVAHLAVGLALMCVAVRFAPRYPRESGVFLVTGAVALFLVASGNTLDHRSILWLHIGLGVAAGRAGTRCVSGVKFRFLLRLALSRSCFPSRPRYGAACIPTRIAAS